MKTRRMIVSMLAIMLFISILTSGVFATIANGKTLNISGYVQDGSVGINLGAYDCYYSYKTTNHRLLFDVTIDPVNATGTTASCKMNYSMKVLNDSYSNLYNLYLINGGNMSEDQFMLNAASSLASTTIGSYSGSWSTSMDSQSGYHTITDNKLVYMHHVFYGKIGNTYNGNTTVNEACAIPSNYSGIKYYY